MKCDYKKSKSIIDVKYKKSNPIIQKNISSSRHQLQDTTFFEHKCRMY